MVGTAKKYEVTVGIPCVQTITLELIADNEADAKRFALVLADSAYWQQEWALDNVLLVNEELPRVLSVQEK